MKQIIVSPSGNKFCYIDSNNNMVDITDKIPTKIIKLYNNLKKILGDKLTIDENLTNNTIEDIYTYIIEKSYQLDTYIYEVVEFKDNPKDKLVIAFNKFFYENIKRNTK